ncbi:MAG: hypothetical protein ACTSU5_03430 [Promethearchaeota archaeon]
MPPSNIERKFRAAIDEHTSLTVYEKESETYWIIKRDLVDYESNVRASEAPISNQILRTPDPFETSVIDISILEKEVFPVNDAIRTVFGDDRDLELLSIRLAVGSKMSDFISIDETDLLNFNVEPTMVGLEEFVETNHDGLVGLIDRRYEHEKGNIVFLEAVIKNPATNIRSIEVKIVTSLQQRGLFMQQNHEYFGVGKYIVIRSKELDDDLLNFLKQIEIDWELIYLRRELSIGNWTEIECERNSANLKGYIRANYPLLGYIDINNMLKIVIKNQYNFKIAVKMAELLSKLKSESSSKEDYDSRPLSMPEIIAAAKLAGAYYGVQEITYDPKISPADIQHFENELIKL